METKTEQFDFRAFGQAIIKARTTNKNLTREQLGGILSSKPRHFVDIENEGYCGHISSGYKKNATYLVELESAKYTNTNIIWIAALCIPIKNGNTL